MEANGSAMCNGHSPPKNTNAGIVFKESTTEFPSIIELKNALPSHVFRSDLKRSMYYVGKDLAICAALYAGLLVAENQPYIALRVAYTVVYWFLQGTFFWSLFVLGHDCGHGSFSSYSLLNDVVGTALHSFILVPFYQWKLSHRFHHRHTGNIDKEEIFYPVRERDIHKDMTLFRPGFMLGFSWFAYLVIGYSPRKINHFNMSETIFENHMFGCASSLCSFALMVCCLFKYTSTFGLIAVIVHYFVPLLVFASWLVIVTFLHHNEVEIPWYSDKMWDNVRGQISSVDRDYGWAQELTHNIGTHQVHHLFTAIPHYHLEDAREAFYKAFPNLIHRCEKSILPSFFRMFEIFDSQRHISNDVDFYMFSDKKGR